MEDNDKLDWADVLDQTASNLRSQSDALMKQARDLRAESQRLRKVAVKARKKRWAGRRKNGKK